MVRQALETAAASGATPWPEVEAVGAWWNRQFDPEIDLVGADRAPVASRIYYLGSIKWLGTPFDQHDLADLRRGAAEVPGFTAGLSGLVIVSLSGTGGSVRPGQVDLEWGPGDVVAAWPSVI